MKTEMPNAATRQNVGSQKIKKKIERNRGEIKQGGNYSGTRNIKITLGRETLKLLWDEKH
jgi:hypothetical protein